MTLPRILDRVLMCALSLAFVSPLHAADSAETEARAAFTQLVTAAKDHKVDEFRKLIAAADLKEMDAMEKERAGFMEMFMGLIAEGGNPADYTAQVTANQITFEKRVTEKSSSGSGTQTTTVRMVREGNQWKFGKLRP